jgi:hypothetical protein
VARHYLLVLHYTAQRSLASRRNPLRLARIMGRMPTDFRDGKTFPRRGRQAKGDALWLLRVADKGRASAAGTIHDYIYPCPMDKGMMERWRITVDEFDDALQRNPTDDLLYAWFTGRVRPDHVQEANEWLLSERLENLDRQDSEEVAAVEPR